MRFIPIIAAVSSVAYAGATQGYGEPAVSPYNAYMSPAPAPAPPAKQDSYSAPPAPSKVPLYGQCGAGEGKWDGPTEYDSPESQSLTSTNNKSQVCGRLLPKAAAVLLAVVGIT